jgi:two-component system sensor histidine kinase/response regulator
MHQGSKLILVVDDMHTSFLALQKKLQALPFKLIFEKDSRKVIETAKSCHPDLILMDFEMPEVNGPSACRQLKADPKTSAIPVLFVTSETSEDKIALAFDSGAEDYILKPVNTKELLARISRILLNLELMQQNQSQCDSQGMLIRTMSHDLVSMLAIAKTDLKLMAKATDVPLCPEQLRIPLKKHNERATRSIDRALALITNVRELQQLEDEKKTIALENVLLSKQFEEALEMLADRIQSKNVQIKIDSPKDVIVFVNPSAFSISIIGNILSNAIKFSQPNDEILIQTEVTEQQIVIRIKDHGIGIPKEILENLFVKGAKTTRVGTNREMGTGFGMLIAKKYMDFFNGKITINSVDIDDNPTNHGTTIELILPRSNLPSTNLRSGQV